MFWPAPVQLALDKTQEFSLYLVSAGAVAALTKTKPRSCRLSSEVRQHRKPVAHARRAVAQRLPGGGGNLRPAVREEMAAEGPADCLYHNLAVLVLIN